MRIRALLAPLVLCAGLAQAQTKAAEPELTVFAAASLTGAFQEIGGMFEHAHPGTRVSFNFAGSQQLATQLEQGAIADRVRLRGPALDGLRGREGPSRR